MPSAPRCSVAVLDLLWFTHCFRVRLVPKRESAFHFGSDPQRQNFSANPGESALYEVSKRKQKRKNVFADGACELAMRWLASRCSGVIFLASSVHIGQRRPHTYWPAIHHVHYDLEPHGRAASRFTCGTG